ncbi:hypothetical protein F2Q68_00012862 [Brassica cretica]|uniref:C3H1-type domain-containing protein n=1 Tax=Brassica cretica TaxID=69181 RepID=A0A8S9HGC4_BRACR|nr:hypothetical protein F2Q68_00012862 [Brassica cretica]
MRLMSDTHHVQSSTGSVRSSQKIEDAFRKMKVNDGNGVEQSDPYPDRPGERDCQFYLRTGLCGYGSTCRFNHPTNLPQQPDLEKRVGVGGYGYPAMVALNAKKGAYAPLKSGFEVKHLIEFVKEAQKGGKGNLPIDGTLEMVKTEAWDGKDGEVVDADEFSLEELMADD